MGIVILRFQRLVTYIARAPAAAIGHELTLGLALLTIRNSAQDTSRYSMKLITNRGPS
jgi:hypothetical protein